MAEGEVPEGEVPEHGSYLYAFVRGQVDAPLPAGVRGAPVRAIGDGPVAALVSTVDLEEFGEEGLRRHLEDLPWVEQVARAHDEVVTAVAAVSPTAPVRLVTVYTGDDAVLAGLAENRAAISETLERIADRIEWGVKVYAVASRPDAASPAPSASTGTDYLMRRRTEREQTETRAADAESAAEDIHQVIAESSVASRRHAPQDPRLTGHQGTMVLNGAYLRDRADPDTLGGIVDGVRREHPELVVEVTGPWPPYSFAQLDQP